MLDQQPFLLASRSIPAPYPYQHETALQPPPEQLELQLPPLDLLPSRKRPLRLESAFVPDGDLPRSVVAGGDRAFKLAVFERVILGLDGQPPVCGIERRSLGHRPGRQHALHLEPEVVVQPPGVVFLHHEAISTAFLSLSAGFRRRMELPLPAVLVERSHGPIIVPGGPG